MQYNIVFTEIVQMRSTTLLQLYSLQVNISKLNNGILLLVVVVVAILCDISWK